MTFTNVSGSDWNTPGNWSSGVPVDGQDVLVNGKVMLTNATASLASYTLAASGMQTNNGWNTVISAQVVTVYGTLTHMTNSATATNASGVWVPNARVQVVCSNFTLATGGTINVNGMGFQGGTNKMAGYGPGGGGSRQTDRGGGGGYGGAGATTGTATGGVTYGSATTPDMPGSGGGGELSYPAAAGGAGGGLVQVFASGAVTINGAITANGLNHNGVHCAGAGSGGGVYIQCATFTGRGSIAASGGSQYVPGGGGRIAVVYTDPVGQAALTPTVQFSAAAPNSNLLQGDHGTLYLPDASFFPYTVLQGSYYMIIPGFTSWSPTSLIVSNGSPRFPNGMQLNVANHVLVNNSGDLWLSNGNFSCGGNLSITNGTLTLYSAATNGVSPGYGALVSVGNNLTVGSGGTIYPWSNPTNGGSVKFTVNNLIIAANGAFNASGKGYAGGTGGSNGFGPGGGWASILSEGRGGGGGYGGFGSWGGATSTGGIVYGSASMPTQPGSGGAGMLNSLAAVGGAGGGLVWVEAAGQVTVDGTINANGINVAPLSAPSGAGSGGGVYLHCGAFTGIGSITANGGTVNVGGGGGRIAVVYTNLVAQALLTPSVQFSTSTALGGNGTVIGTPGTLYFPDASFFPYPVLSGSYQIVIPGCSSAYTFNSLTVTNGWPIFPAGYAIQVTSNLTVGKAGILVVSNNALSCGGNLTLTNGGLLSVYAGPTNGVSPNYGACVGVTGTLFVASGSTNYV